MIDLHSHILPGIDDGARTVKDSLDVAKQSLDQGITHMMCTPHIHEGIYNNNKKSIACAFISVLRAIADENIPLKIAYACEVRVSASIVSWVEQNKLPFIGKWHNKDALLLELPHSHVPPGVENLIRWLLKNNIQPVIPHPERNREILANTGKVKWLKHLGCELQITAGSFTGRFGANVEASAWSMIQDNLVTYIASDTHSVDKRPNEMRAAYEKIASEHSKVLAQKLCKDIPEQITSGKGWL